MGKRRAAYIASRQAIASAGLEDQVKQLNVMVDNLQVLLKRETAKNADLEAKVKSYETAAKKSSSSKAKKTSKDKVNKKEE